MGSLPKSEVKLIEARVDGNSVLMKKILDWQPSKNFISKKINIWTLVSALSRTIGDEHFNLLILV